MKSKASVLVAFAGFSLNLFAGHPETPAPDPAPAPPADVLLGDWGGLRPTLASHGIVPGLTYVGETFGNTTGGIRRAATYEGLLTLTLDVDLHTLAGWPGAKFHFAGVLPHGAGLTQRSLGDVGVISSIDAYDGARLDSIWLEQSFGGDRFSLRIGAMAVDDEFYQTSTETLFLHSAFGWATALGLNVPLPTYPYTTLGLRLKAQPTRWSYVMVGAFDGNPAPGLFRDPSPQAAPSGDFNKHGTAFALRHDEGAFLITEAGVHFNDPSAPADTNEGKKAVQEPRGYFTSVRVGFGYHTDTFTDSYDATLVGLRSSLAPARAQACGGDWAIYAQADRELYREPGTDAQGLSAFLHGACMPPDRNAYDFSGEAGLVYTGLIPHRDDDLCGLGCALIHASAPSVAATRDANRAAGSSAAVSPYELAIEATYNAHLRPGMWLQPDLQFIVHPGATTAHGNAFVIGLRTTINF